jgi:hypothetical protein
MSTPTAAISEEQHGLYGAGRLYGVEDFDASTLRTADDTREALHQNLLMPSVTNIIGLYPMSHLQSWFGREAVKTLGAVNILVDTARNELLNKLVGASVTGYKIALAARSNVPPVTALERHLQGRLNLEELVAEGAEWVTATEYALTNAYSLRDFESAVFGHANKPVKKGFNTFFLQMKKGNITQTEHDYKTSTRRKQVLDILRSLPDANWLYASLANSTAGISLLGLAAERSRDVSADYGNEVHDLIEQLTLNPEYPHDGQYQFHVNGWNAWRNEFKPTGLLPELSVFGVTSDGLAYAGTADLFAQIDGQGTVCDYKTSKTLSETTVALQMAALAKASTVPFEITSAVALHLPRKVDAEKLFKYKPKGDVTYNQYKLGYRAYTLNAEAINKSWDTFSAARALWQELYVQST